MKTTNKTAGQPYLGRRIRTTRNAAGRTLLSVSADAGIAEGALSLIENGHRNPSLGTLIAIADALGVTVAKLVSPNPAE